eukprot:gb/GEZN01009019.1/.p1 GENE.gb/GEZN01009019.1/~~gb/GEZN01009019.1/.p1  ORF type:complete len:397 (+),score=27.95 gb/GEZN01009019.1/:22-1212(+)
MCLDSFLGPCSDHGTCINQQCHCLPHWSGSPVFYPRPGQDCSDHIMALRVVFSILLVATSFSVPFHTALFLLLVKRRNQTSQRKFLSRDSRARIYLLGVLQGFFGFVLSLTQIVALDVEWVRRVGLASLGFACIAAWLKIAVAVPEFMSLLKTLLKFETAHSLVNRLLNRFLTAFRLPIAISLTTPLPCLMSAIWPKTSLIGIVWWGMNGAVLAGIEMVLIYWVLTHLRRLLHTTAPKGIESSHSSHSRKHAIYRVTIIMRLTLCGSGLSLLFGLVACWPFLRNHSSYVIAVGMLCGEVLLWGLPFALRPPPAVAKNTGSTKEEVITEKQVDLSMRGDEGTQSGQDYVRDDGYSMRPDTGWDNGSLISHSMGALQSIADPVVAELDPAEDCPAQTL